MSVASSSVQLPDHILTVARDQAKRRGLSVEDWVAAAVVEHIGSTDAAQDFFRGRATGARKGALREALDAIPNRPPDPGDEL